MSYYSIKDLERLTGIKAHTIRIWEKRYNIVDPNRSDSNIRSYCDGDLKKLLSISILNRNGLKISTICKLSTQQINEKVFEVLDPENDYQSQIEGLVVSMIELNEERFERILNQSITRIGFEDTLFYVVYPFFEKVGLLWQTGTICPAQEHFITNLIRLKLSVAIDNLPIVTNTDAKHIFLFLPEWELHEMGLLTYYYMARKQGFKVIYLGQKVPMPDLFVLAEKIKADLLVTFFVTGISEINIQNYLQSLCAHFKTEQIIVSGMQAAEIADRLPKNVHFVRGTCEFKSLLKQINN
ncbi:MAG: MerR family transcriptional regulator [Bacteroidales bacterium]|nr:MerR family transcriptional regulator [Bacteroidales bacterium]